MITMFFTAKKLIMLDVFPKRSTFNQLYFINNIFPDLKTASLNFRHQRTGSTFWAHMGNSMCHNGLKVTSKIKKNYISRMLDPPYSRDRSPRDSGLFGMLRQILRDGEFSSSDAIEDVIAQGRNGLTFEDVQSVPSDWIRRVAWVAENDGEHNSE
jgi:hypothetical protein